MIIRDVLGICSPSFAAFLVCSFSLYPALQNCQVLFTCPFYSSKELVMSKTELAKRLNLTQPAVSIAVRRGEKIARGNQYQLIDD